MVWRHRLLSSRFETRVGDSKSVIRDGWMHWRMRLSRELLMCIDCDCKFDAIVGNCSWREQWIEIITCGSVSCLASVYYTCWRGANSCVVQCILFIASTVYLFFFVKGLNVISADSPLVVCRLIIWWCIWLRHVIIRQLVLLSEYRQRHYLCLQHSISGAVTSLLLLFDGI